MTVNPDRRAPTTGSTPISGTLVNTYTNQPVPNEPVTLTVNGTQSCTATTNARGVATCPVTPNEPAGHLLARPGRSPGTRARCRSSCPTSGSSTFTVTQAPTTFTYTGHDVGDQRPVGHPVGRADDQRAGARAPTCPARRSTFTLGSGSSLQSCSATTNASGAASCTITDVNQSTGTAGISASYGGDTVLPVVHRGLDGHGPHARPR